MFSVVVPTFNKEQFIKRTIDSVLAQDFEDFQLIVVNDGSSDDTLRIVSAIDDTRLVIVDQQNRGEGEARNAGMRAATQPWIAFLDADDYWFSDHLSELRRVIDAFPDAGMVATSFMEGDAWSAQPPHHRSTTMERINYFETAGQEIGVVWSSTAAIRRDVTRTVGDFGRYRRGADQEYWVRTALHTPVARSRRVTAYYFRHEGGVMATDHSRKEVAPDGIADMWPSVAVIHRVRHDPVYSAIQPGFDAYERHATYLSMIGYISRHEFNVARRLAKRMPGTRFDRAAAVAAVLCLPDVLIDMLLHARRFVRGRHQRQ